MVATVPEGLKLGGKPRKGIGKVPLLQLPQLYVTVVMATGRPPTTTTMALALRPSLLLLCHHSTSQVAGFLAWGKHSRTAPPPPLLAVHPGCTRPWRPRHCWDHRLS